jgi:hypothetical protein
MTATAAPRQTATERRLAAINALTEEVRSAVKTSFRGGPPHVTVVWSADHADRAAVAAAIRELAPLGRTERWADAVSAWAREVEGSSTEEMFKWAFDQFGIWACYAAE